MKTEEKEQIFSGISYWNIYFIIKIALFAQGIIAFHALENFAFITFLLIPIKNKIIRIARQIIALPIAFWLMHYDSFLPPLSHLWSQIGQVLQFKISYLIELVSRFISIQYLLAIFILCFAYYFLNKILRISVFVIIALAYISLPSGIFDSPLENSAPKIKIAQNTNLVATESEATGPVNDALLNLEKDRFFNLEAKRKVTFPSMAPSAPFDLLFISICSLAWDDVVVSGLTEHPFFKQFDIMFDNFSAATSYSGPALVRLLRASCGQETHQELYAPAPSKQCMLFDNLAKLGFKENLMLNHDGHFDDFLGLLKNQGNVKAPLISQQGLPQYESAFDDSPIYRDKDVLQRWLDKRKKEGNDATVCSLQ